MITRSATHDESQSNRCFSSTSIRKDCLVTTLHIALSLFLFTLYTPMVWADVGGTPQTLYRQFQVFGGSEITGNTLMGASVSSPLVNSRLLASSPGDINNIPFDATISGAFLFWSGSTLNTPDRSVDLTLPDGTFANDISAERCLRLNSFGGFFACRADVTQFVSDHPGVQNYNGRYIVSDLSAEPGTLNPDGSCAEPRECQAKYAAWSLVLVYTSPSSSTLRDIIIYDGFRSFDETSFSPGIAQYSIGGFDFPNNGRASIAYLGMEGDALLGVPPQDTDPNQQLRCNTCFDFFEVNGQKVNDANNPPNNVFNSSSEIGYTLGVDLDQFDISTLLTPGDSVINLRVGSGDGLVNPMSPDPGGGGELFLLSYIVLNVDRNAPNFNREGTEFTVIPDEAAPLERVVFTLRIENQGSLTATGVSAQVDLANGLTYFPGSLRIDGLDPVPGQEQQNPLAMDYNLGQIPFQGNNDRIITFRASIDQGISAGTQLVSQATISANNITDSTRLNAIVNVLGVPPLGQATKVVIDGDGDNLFAPGEIIQYRINIPNPNARPLSGIRLIDQLPPYIDLFQVISGGGIDRSDPSLNRVILDNLNIDSNSSIDIVIIAQIHDSNQLEADGISPAEIDGFLVSNQAQVSLGAEVVLSDDPTTNTRPDETIFSIDAGVDIRGNGTRKEVSDLNGGLVEPGDLIQYSVRIRNTGASGGQVNFTDQLPIHLNDCEIQNAPAGIVCENIGDRWQINGLINLLPDDTVRVTFNTRIKDNVADRTALVNEATIRVVGDEQQVITVQSPQLIVTSSPRLLLDKRALGGATVERNGTINYEIVVKNTGNSNANSISIFDPVGFEVQSVQVSDGGVWIPANGGLGGQAQWTIPTLAPGEELRLTLDLELAESIGGGRLLSNQANLNYEGFTGQILSDDPNTSTPLDPTVVSVIGNGPILSLTKSVSPAAVLSGQRVRFDFALRNAGDAPLINASVLDQLPPTLINPISTSGIILNNSIRFDQNSVPSLGIIDPGEVVNLSFTVEVNATPEQEVFNQAEASAGGNLSTLSDNPNTPQALDPTQVIVEREPEIILSKSVEDLNGGAFEPGDIVRYTISAQYQVGVDPDNILIQDPIPLGLSNVSPLDGGELFGGLVRWRISELGSTRPSAQVRFEATISPQVENGQRISNQASLSAINLSQSIVSDDQSTSEPNDPTTFVIQGLAQLSIASKQVEPRNAAPGDRVNWTIEIENAGPSIAKSVIVTDSLSRWLTDVDVVGGSISGGQAIWEIGDLGVNQRRVLTLRTRLSERVVVDDLVANQALIQGENLSETLTDDPTTPIEGDPTQLTVLPRPTLIFTKQINKEQPIVNPGETFRYQLTVRNTGERALNNVIITDQLPSQIRGIEAIDGQLTGNVATWILPTLLPNAQRTLNLEVSVSSAANVGDIINNQANLASSDGLSQLSDDPSTAQEVDPTAIRVVGQSNVQMSKRVIALEQPPFVPGSRVRYELELSHSGDGVATELQIDDPLPLNLSQVNSEDGVVNNNRISWSIPVLNIEERRVLSFEATIAETADIGSIIANQAELQWREGGTPVLSDNPDTPQIDPTTFIVQAPNRLTFTKVVSREDGQNSFTPGSTIIYDLTITNDGPGPSESLDVRDQLSPSLVPISERLWTSVDGLSATLQGSLVTWTVPIIAEGNQIRLRVGAQIADDLNAGEIILNQAEARPFGQATASPILSDDPNTPALFDPTALTVADSSQLILEKVILSDSSNFAPGGIVTYQLQVTNLSNNPVERIALADPLPSGMEYVGSNPPSVLSAEGVVSWSRFNLQVAETTFFELRLRIGEAVPEGSEISNQALLSTQLNPPVLSDNPQTPEDSDPTRFTVSSSARLSLAKEVRDVNGGALKPGDTVEFTLTIQNVGSETAQDIEVIDPLSSLLVDVNPIGGTVSDQIARWRILQLDPEASRTFIMSARVRDNAQSGDLLTNQFAAREPEAAFTLSPEVSLTVQADQFTFTKQAQPILSDRYVAGGVIEYTISIQNTGSSTLDNVIVSDPLPIDLLESIAVSDGGQLNGSQVTWDSSTTPALSNIMPESTVTLQVRAQINPQLRLGREIINQAALRLSAGDPSIPLYLSDDPTTPVLNDPTKVVVSSGSALIFTKDISSPSNRQQINPGDEVTYRISIQNIGQSPSPVLLLGDVPDASLRLLAVEVDGVSRDPLALLQGSLSIDPLVSQQTVDVLLTCQVDPQALQGTTVFNQATFSFESDNGLVNSVSDDPLTAAPDDPTGFVIGGSVELFMLKTARVDSGETFAQSGDLIEWNIKIFNQGEGRALQLNFSDELPNEVTYLPNSIRLNGLAVTDALDQDSGQFINGNNEVQIILDQLDSNGIAEITFQTRVNPIPPNGVEQTVNQALLIYNQQMIQSDQDDNPNNGLNPTVVPLKAAPIKTYLARLTLVDDNGPPALIAETVGAEIILDNTGTSILENLEFNLPIPVGLIYESAVLQQNIGTLRFEPANPQMNQSSPEQLGTLYLRDLALEAGSQVRIQVTFTVDPNLEDNKDLCLQGTLSDLDFDPDNDQGVGQIVTDRACFEGQIVFGRLSGEVFQDLNNNDLFDKESDLPLSGMIVSVWRGDLPEGEAIATDFSDQDGNYLLENLRPGPYQLRLKSSQGVAFTKSLAITITALEENKQSLEVEPTGRVYDSVSGELLDGAQLFLYRDEDLGNDDPFDDASLLSRTLVPDSVFDSPTQQGQRSAQGGMYRFDVNEPGRYLIEVIPPGVRFVAPSSLVPPLPNFINASGDELRLSPSALPSASADQVRRYTLAFEVAEEQQDRLQIVHNHIPLDPLSSLIQIDKRSRRVQYMVGDIVTYEIDVINRSPKDLLYDSLSRAGGVFIEDILPKGLKYIAQSAVWVEVVGAKERPLFSAEPSGNRILRFGKEDLIGDETGTVERIQLPLDLKAGAHLRLRYQVVISPQAKPLRSYTNRARVLADGDIPISSTVEAKIQVIADPDFDQGLLLGRVWCDQNQNGLFEPNEPGLVGAKVYFDSGMYAVTDSSGKYHFKLIDPGTHAVKIDQDSLLPGAQLTTDEMRVLYFTRGLPARVNFGVTCPQTEVKDSMVELGKTALKEALGKLGREAVIIKGNTEKLNLQVGALIFSAPPVEVYLQTEENIPDVIPPPDGAPIEELIFETKIPVGTKSEVQRWTLWIAREGAEERPVLSGVGTPPKILTWDGKDQLGTLIAKRGRVLSYRFELVTSDLVVSSPLHRMGIGVTMPPEPEVLLAFPTSPFNSDEPRQIDRIDQTHLSEVIRRLKKGYEGRLLVDVHGSGEEDAAFLTSTRAEAIAKVLQNQLGLKSNEIQFEGSGNQYPLIPNLTQLNKKRNRRVLIRLEQLKPNEEALDLLTSPVLTAPIVRAGKEERRPLEDGHFVMVTDIPQHGTIEVHLRDRKGASVTFAIPLAVRRLTPVSSQKDPYATQPLSLGGQWGEQLSLAGETLPSNIAYHRLDLEESKVDQIKLKVHTKSTENDQLILEVRSWSLLSIEDGEALEVEMGTGQVPTSLNWSPLDLLSEESKVGLRLKVVGDIIPKRSSGQTSGLAGRFISYTPILWVKGNNDKVQRIIETNSQTQLWRLKLNAEEVSGQADQRIEKLFSLKSGQSTDLVITRPDGSQFQSKFIPPKILDLSKTISIANQKKTVLPKIQDRSSNDMSLWIAGGMTRLLDPRHFPSSVQGQESLKIDLQLPSDALMSTQQKDGDTKDSLSKSSDSLTKDQSLKTSKYRNFGTQELLKATTDLLKSRAKVVAAQDLVVKLPQGKELSSLQVAVSGKTKPSNRIFLNGVEIPVDEQGHFVGACLLGEEATLEVKSIDPDGNIARIQKQYILSDQAWFLLALGESLTGALGSELDGVQAHTSTKVGDQIYIHGRAVAYLKGRIKGDQILGGLFKKYEITAHLDTAKQQEFETYFKQMIDPNRYYPVYGDSAQEVMDVNSRGPLYVLVKADRSLLQAGNFRTQIRGIELLNYDRSLYGAQVSLDLSKNGWRHQAQVFGATQDQAERHAYVELRGTGGSLYYLPHRELIEGSERLYIIERDRISNMERRRVSLTRNIDYSIRYQDGRLLMMKPVNSSSLDTFGALPQPTGSQNVLDGHPTFISIEYDHRDAQEQGEDAWGAYMRETWSDQKGRSVAVGGGFIQEQQGDVAQEHYRLWGGHMTYQHARKTGFAFEYAKSLNQNAENLFSQDGGLTFQPFSLRTNRQEANGQSFLVKGQVELDDLIGKGDQDWIWLEGYWRYAAPGFYAGGNIQQQGTENFGFKANYRLNKQNVFVLNYDEMATEQTPFEINPFITDYRRRITRFAHQYSAERFTLESAWTRSENEQGADPEGNIPPVFSSDIISSAAQYKLTPKLTLLGEQEVVLRGDRRLYEKTSDLFVTSLGARYRLSETLQLEGVQSLRWSGDNATQLGIRSEVSKGRTVYAQQRLIDQLGRRTNSSVIGAEERFAQGARAFSEYQFESGQLGQRNRAILGIGKRTQLIKGLTLDANYQRSQILNNFSGMQTGSGDLSQDALSIGIEWLAHPQIKLSSRIEVRFDDTDEWQGQRDKNQILTLNNLSYQLNQDLTLQLRFNYSITEDEVFQATEAEFMEASFGVAYRPLKQRWLAILFKATSRFEQRPIDLSLERPEVEEMSVLSLIPIFELPYNFQLVEKIAYKRSALIVENLIPTVSHNLLWINRLNYHLTNTWDIGAEYRVLQNTLAQSTQHGLLFELNYIIKKKIRVGAGYNFTSFTDDEFARFDEQYGGPFFRVMAQY